jgi:glycosyltransferase involved in cell wall biosynthesis
MPTEQRNKVKITGDWFPLERSGDGNYFRWMGKSGTIVLGTHDYNSIKVNFSAGPTTIESRTLNIDVGGDLETNVPIDPGQNGELIIPVKNTPSVRLTIPTFVASKEDKRALGICIHDISLISPETDIVTLPINKIELETDIDLDKVDKALLDAASGSSNNNIVSLTQLRALPFKGIYYIGQYGTCGYAAAAKGYLCEFYRNHIPVTWEPLNFDDSRLGDDNYYNLIAKSLINKKIKEYDTVIIHCTPDLWPLLLSQRPDVIRNKRVIGYAVWETSKLHPSWVEKMNRSVHEIWCPSQYNKKVFEDSGVKVPITVIPHIFLKFDLPDRDKVHIYSHTTQNVMASSTRFTFYNISEMNARKGVDDLLKTYCESFTSYDNVRLLLKVHHRGYSIENKMHCVHKINEICSKYPNPPRIDYILNNMSDTDIASLHAIGDCYVSLCKSEGFGLPIYEAHKYGKQIIATGHGGHLDFLGNEHPGLVKYELAKVKGMENFSKMYIEESEWALPDLEHAKELMKGAYERAIR